MLDRRSVRNGLAVLLAVAAYFLTQFGVTWESRLLIGWNVGAIIELVLAGVMMYRSDARRTLERSQKEDPSAVFSVVAVILASAAGLVANGYMLNNTKTMTPLQTHLHLALAMLTVITAWLLVHTYFAGLYARIYYRKTGAGDDPSFAKGLDFVGSEIVDYWDFVYYSFTIAMCYQTSDVSVTARGMRQVTIVHSIVSFFFVTVTIGLVVGIIQNFA